MGHIKYTIDKFDKKFYMFAKANIDEDLELKNIIYYAEYFKYPFIDETIPYFIGIRPEVKRTKVLPNKDFLDKLYTNYSEKEKRLVEGFIIINNNTIKKYVRLKIGKLEEYRVYMIILKYITIKNIKRKCKR